jgi:ribosomal protein S26
MIMSTENTDTETAKERGCNGKMNCIKCGNVIDNTPWVYDYTAFDQTKTEFDRGSGGGANYVRYMVQRMNLLPFQIQICCACGEMAFREIQRTAWKWLVKFLIGSVVFILCVTMGSIYAINKPYHNADLRYTLILCLILVLTAIGFSAYFIYDYRRNKVDRGDKYFQIGDHFYETERTIISKLLAGRGYFQRDLEKWGARMISLTNDRLVD